LRAFILAESVDEGSSSSADASFLLVIVLSVQRTSDTEAVGEEEVGGTSRADTVVATIASITLTFSISISSFVDSTDKSTFSVYSDLAIGTQSAVLAVVFAVSGYALAVSVSVGCAVGRTDSASHTITVAVQNESTLAHTLAESVVVAVVIAHNWSVLGNADIVSVFETRVAHALAKDQDTVVGALVIGSGVTVAVTASDVGGNALTSLTSVPLILFTVVVVIIIAIIWSGTIEEGNLVDELSWFEDLTVGL
jgi:hypothetical protein